MKLFLQQEYAEIDVLGIKVKVRSVPASKVAEIKKKHMKEIGKTGRLVADKEAITMDLFCESIVAWDAKDVGGNGIPCSEKMKKEVYEHNQDFVLMVTAKAGKAFRELKERNEKNSEPGVSGT